MSNQNLQDVTITPLPGGPGHWELAHAGKSSGDPNSYPHVNLAAKGGPYLIHFTIKGQNAYKFGPDPIWVQTGSKPNVSGPMDPQIVAVVASANGKELFVLDKNDGGAQQLYYRLNTTGYGSVDPIIDNGGSNMWGGLTTMATILVLGTAVAAFLIGMFVYKQFCVTKGIRS